MQQKFTNFPYRGACAHYATCLATSLGALSLEKHFVFVGQFLFFSASSQRPKMEKNHFVVFIKDKMELLITSSNTSCPKSGIFTNNNYWVRWAILSETLLSTIFKQFQFVHSMLFGRVR